MATSTPQHSQDFVSIFLTNHRRLYAYIVAMTPTLEDADDVLQKTSLVLWKRWEDFDHERDFFPWACGIARIQVRNHLSQNGRRSLTLLDDASQLVAQQFEHSEKDLDSRIEHLRHCLQKLSQSQQTLIQRCYQSDCNSIQLIAREMKITPNSLYQRLKRLRELLHSCVDRMLLSGGAT